MLIVKSGQWQITLNDGAHAQSVTLGPQDMLSVPAGSWRRFQLLEAGENTATAGTGELLVVNGENGRFAWSGHRKLESAFDAGWMLSTQRLSRPSCGDGHRNRGRLIFCAVHGSGGGMSSAHQH